ncbi:diguanylate cyclase (GGDEF)-like protein [Pseudomonas sp. BP6]|nr:diguanylate cyclase (GGDEF)-like protein [Pseudomonas sp. BP6]MBP2289347.1 diguanylate cyclase (GGDEF)-like protein [Pseudomonas sp. BP7]
MAEIQGLPAMMDPAGEQQSQTEEQVVSPRLKVLDLRLLILGLVLLAVLATLANALATAYRVQREALIEHALQSNSAYAAKLASSIDEFIRAAHSHLQFSAEQLGRHWGNSEVFHAEVRRLQQQDADFNSIAIVDTTLKVLDAYPDALQINGSTLHSEAVNQALAARQPYVSSAYVSAAGNLVVFVSVPIFDASHRYVGIIGGSIYLKQEGALHTLISQHFYHEGTFAFVADRDRQLLYHPEKTRIGEKLGWSKTVDAALLGQSGAMAVRNYKGIPMLAGYAQVSGSGWAVVAQQPQEASLAPLSTLMRNMILGMVPAAIIGIILIGGGAMMISRPLRELSRIAGQLAAPRTTDNLQRLNAWYREAAAIRQAMLTGVQLLQAKMGRLNRQALTDPLTGLANRRAMDEELRGLQHAGRAYSVLSVDIDYFKRVNDTFGHDNGDLAIKQVAQTLMEQSRTADLACRAGGEEFLLILPDTGQDAATVIAERVRQAVANSEIPVVGHITVSIGVASCAGEAIECEAVLKQADECLYRAKEMGRNRVESFMGVTA